MSNGIVRFFVATDGDDAWSGAVPEPNAGRTDGPFATLTRARDAVRELKLDSGLDGPGEWCLDAEAGDLYFRPPGSAVDSGEVTAPVADRLVQMIGSRDVPVRHVSFRGFTFTQTRAVWPTPESYYKTPNAGQCFYMQDTQDCAVADNLFDAIGGDALRLQDNNSRDRIEGNEIRGAGAYGIFVGGFQRGFSRHDTVAGDVPSPTEWHRDLFDQETVVRAWPRSGHHLIHNNHMHHLSLETCDTGGLTANRWYTYDKDPELCRGNVIRFNFIHDVVGCGAYAKKMEPGGDEKAGGRIWTPYYSWAIYFDNAPMDVLVYGNVTARNTLGGIMVSHYCRNVTVENNIFVDSDKSQAYLLLAGQMANLRLMRNIFSYTNPEAAFVRLNMGAGVEVTEVLTEFDGNVLFHAGGKEPTVDGLPGEAVERMGTAMQDAGDQTAAGWRAIGFDEHSVFADPKFVDAANDNYALHPDSPALALGFQPIDMARIGLVGGESD